MKIGFASDFDNTLYFDSKDNKISREDIDAIREFQNHQNIFGICTGRPYVGLSILADYDIKPDFFIVSNGALILDGLGHELYKAFISCIDARTLFDYMDEKAEVVFQTANGCYSIHEKTTIPVKQNIVHSIDDIKEDILTISFKMFSCVAASVYTALINSRFKALKASQNTFYIDVTADVCSKGNALKFAKSSMQIDCMNAIGDSYNDISMLQAADVSYTFHSSDLPVRQCSKHLVNSLSEAIENSLDP